MAYARRECTEVQSESWLQHMRECHEEGLKAFEFARSAIEKRAEQLCVIVSKELAIAYKLGDPFPAHFEWAGRSYALAELEELQHASRTQRKNKTFLLEMLAAMVAGREWDRLATLIIGLTVSQKVVTHWSFLDEDGQTD